MKAKIQGKDGHVKMGTEVGTKECLGLPEAGRPKEGSFLRGFGMSMILPTL